MVVKDLTSREVGRQVGYERLEDRLERRLRETRWKTGWNVGYEKRACWVIRNPNTLAERCSLKDRSKEDRA